MVNGYLVAYPPITKWVISLVINGRFFMGFQVFAKLVNITPISLGFTVDILILNLVGGFNHLETYEFVS